jgi:hypothetical protein
LATEKGVTRENQQPAASHWKTLSQTYMMQRHAIILSQQYNDTAISIRYILSDRLLFGHFKQSLHNVG